MVICTQPSQQAVQGWQLLAGLCLDKARGFLVA
jgi:hypothetical protein